MQLVCNSVFKILNLCLTVSRGVSLILVRKVIGRRIVPAMSRFTRDDETLWKTNRDQDSEDGYPRGWTRPSHASKPTPASEQRDQSASASPPSNTAEKGAEASSAAAAATAAVTPPAAPPLPPGGLRIPGGGAFKTKAKADSASPMGRLRLRQI